MFDHIISKRHLVQQEWHVDSVGPLETVNLRTAKRIVAEAVVEIGGSLTLGEIIKGINPASIGAVGSDDTRLSDARTPLTHAANHALTGSDPLTPTEIGALSPPPEDGKHYLATSDGWVKYTAPEQPFPIMVGKAVSYFGTVLNKTMFEPNYLYADGRAISRDDYSELFAVCGITYGTGDGTTTFNVPDLRGVFIRGLDEGRGLDPARNLGTEYQGDAIRNIEGEFYVGKSGQYSVGSTASGAMGVKNSSSGDNNANVVANTGTIVSFDASRVVPTAAENRPVNMACHWFIVARSTSALS